MENENLPLNIAIAFGESVGKESISKLTDVIGGFFPFFGLKRKSVSVYLKEIQDSDISSEAKMMAIANTKKTFKELNNQWAIGQIAYNTAKDGTDFSETSSVNDEWLNRFMDSAKFVSSEEGQMLWGYVLAGEFEKPGIFPLQVIRILSEISPQNAKVFSNICNLLVKIIHLDTEGKSTEDDTEECFLLDKTYEECYKSLDISFNALSELKILGLIQYETLTGFIEQIDSNKSSLLRLSYAGNEATIVKFPDKEFPLGDVILTQTGRSIARFSEKTEVDGHFDNIIKNLKNNGVEFSEFS